MLFAKTGPGENIVIRGARVLDSAEGVDAVLDVRIDAGTITAIGAGLDTNEHRVVAGAGLVLAPAFVDPHVHLRTPGREDEETIASGTAAAAAGGSACAARKASARRSRCAPGEDAHAHLRLDGLVGD